MHGSQCCRLKPLERVAIGEFDQIGILFGAGLAGPFTGREVDPFLVALAVPWVSTRFGSSGWQFTTTIIPCA